MIDLRQQILTSLYALVAVGLPFWLWTTHIHRAPLPVDTIAAWHDARDHLAIPIHVGLPSDLPLSLCHAINQQHQQGANAAALHHGETPSWSLNMTCHGAKQEGVESSVSSRRPTFDYEILIDDQQTSKSTPRKLHVETDGRLRLTLPSSDTAEKRAQVTQAILQNMLDEESYYLARPLPQAAIEYEPELSIVLSLVETGDVPATENRGGTKDADVQTLLQRYLVPFAESLRDVHTIQLWAQHKRLRSMPFLDTTGHAIHSEHISETVNHLESVIFDPSTNRVKELHLVMLLPTEANAGLHFLDNNGQRARAALVPQWGGITILGGTDFSSLKDGLSYLMKHLYTLLDLPSPLEHAIALTADDAPLSVSMDRYADGRPTAYMVSQLLRRRALECIKESKHTLLALTRLTERIPTMIIQDRIAKRVDDALNVLHVRGSMAHERKSLSWAAAKLAFVESNRAFFDETMVSQLYFPAEHTYAIYLPLFLPISISILLMTLKEVRNLLRTSRRVHVKVE